MNEGITVRGGATREELAAVLAVIRPRPRAADEDAYRRWRRIRLDALRRSESAR